MPAALVVANAEVKKARKQIRIGFQGTDEQLRFLKQLCSRCLALQEQIHNLEDCLTSWRALMEEKAKLMTRTTYGT